MKSGGFTKYEASLGIAYACGESSNAALRLLRSHTPEEIWAAARHAQLVNLGMAPIPAQKFLQARGAEREEEAVKRRAQALDRAGLRFIAFGDPGYPQEFLALSHPPAGLFIRGNEERVSELLTSPRITIVGTRRASTYGMRAAREFAGAFAARGIAVVSGMALGVDGRAHEAALEEGGLTIAILGCGADVVYPARHRPLYDRITENGLIISELPPGTSPSKWTFPNRNRLLAALGDGVLVAEGSVTSGAMQTAEQAANLGRVVFAVPGPIYNESHTGCNLLIRDGGIPAIDPQAAVEEFLLQTRMERGERQPPGSRRETRGGAQSPLEGLAATGRDAILEVMDDRPCSIDSLVLMTGLTARHLTVALAEMELTGLVLRAGPGLYIRAP